MEDKEKVRIRITDMKILTKLHEDLLTKINEAEITGYEALGVLELVAWDIKIALSE